MGGPKFFSWKWQLILVFCYFKSFAHVFGLTQFSFCFFVFKFSYFSKKNPIKKQKQKKNKETEKFNITAGELFSFFFQTHRALCVCVCVKKKMIVLSPGRPGGCCSSSYRVASFVALHFLLLATFCCCCCYRRPDVEDGRLSFISLCVCSPATLVKQMISETRKGIINFLLWIINDYLWKWRQAGRQAKAVMVLSSGR